MKRDDGIICAVCDDLTGAASAGALLSQRGIRTGLFFRTDQLYDPDIKKNFDAIFISTNTRHSSTEEAYSTVAEATKDLLEQGGCFFSKKIDSTLRGRIGYEIDAMLDTLGDDTIAVMVPVLPAAGRICVDGNLWVYGKLLTETSIGNDVKAPVHENHVPTLVRRQSRRKIGHISIDKVCAGSMELREAMQEAIANGARILVMDSKTEEDVERIAGCCIELERNVLAVDPGLFTASLVSKKYGFDSQTAGKPIKNTERTGKTALLIIGSANPHNREQMQHLIESERRITVICLCAERLIGEKSEAEKEIRKAVAQAMKRFADSKGKPEVILVESGLNGPVINLTEEDRKRDYPPGHSSFLINRGLAEVARKILDFIGSESIAGLFLTGGDTMEQVCDAIGVQCIEVTGQIAPQVDTGKIIGRYDGLPVVVKGGFCGEINIGNEIVDWLIGKQDNTAEKKVLF